MVLHLGVCCKEVTVCIRKKRNCLFVFVLRMCYSVYVSVVYAVIIVYGHVLVFCVNSVR